MVAKSFQSLKIADEPFNENGRPYVHVITKTGSLRKVRWYSENEYYKMYPEDRNSAADPYYKPQKEVLGFNKGYITIFKGNNISEEREYFRNNSARYAKWWGWYFVSTEELPDDIPDDVTPIKLNWELVGNEDGSLKSSEEVRAAVENLIYDADESEYQGEIGDKIEIIVTIEKSILLDGYYGPSTLYSMKDENKNVYIWITASIKTRLKEGCSYKIKGIIKEHKQYRAQKQTILTRCVVIK